MVFINGGFMKQFTSQKWILSTLLFAALGSQYYFSTSSKDAGFIEMSQLAAVPEQAIIEVAAALDRSRPPADTAPAVAAPLTGDRTVRQKTEAVNPVAPCSDCVTLTKAEAERIRQILIEVTGKKTATKADVDVAETPAEKMKREREDREDKKREDKLAKDQKKHDIELAKAEKKKEEQDTRDEKFRSDFERLSARCNDVECHSSSLATALNRYSDKSRMVSAKAVNEVFAEHIAKELRDGLKDPENKSAAAALETLMAELPATYKNLKTKSIDIAKAVTAPKAVEANASYKQAESLRKANKLNESNIAFTRANEQKAELEYMLRSQYEAIHDGTEKSEDKTTYTYYNVNYAKPASQWLADIMTGTTFTTEAAGTATTVNPLAPTGRGVVRGGNGTTVVGNPIVNTIGTQNATQGFRGGRSN